MRKIGIIGGLSWVSTAAYYRRINQLAAERLGGVASARLSIESVERHRYVEAVIDRGDEEAACAMILEAAIALEKAGAAFVVISCNDVHRFVPEIAPRIGIPFLHIVDATASAIRAAGLRRVALIGVRKTMEGTFYPEGLGRHGVETIVPDEDEKRFVHDTIYEELVRDVFRPETRAGYADLARALAARGAEGVVLGCTEIPLLIGPGDVEVPLFDTTELHCRAALDAALA